MQGKKGQVHHDLYGCKENKKTSVNNNRFTAYYWKTNLIWGNQNPPKKDSCYCLGPFMIKSVMRIYSKEIKFNRFICRQKESRKTQYRDRQHCGSSLDPQHISSDLVWNLVCTFPIKVTKVFTQIGSQPMPPTVLVHLLSWILTESLGASWHLPIVIVSHAFVFRLFSLQNWGSGWKFLSTGDPQPISCRCWVYFSGNKALDLPLAEYNSLPFTHLCSIRGNLFGFSPFRPIVWRKSTSVRAAYRKKHGL